MSKDPTKQTPQPGSGYPKQPTQQPYKQAQPQQPQPTAPYGVPASMGAGFDFNAFVKQLKLHGQIAVACGVLLIIAFFLTWYSVTYFGAFNLSYSGPFIANHAGGPAFLMWLIPLAGLALAVFPIVGALGKMPGQAVNMAVLGAAGVALLCEIVFLIKASAVNRDTTISANGLDYGPSFGFYFAVLLTLAAGGVWSYFNFIKKPAMPGMMGMPLAGQPPYQQSGQVQQPGSQPYVQPGSPPYSPHAQYPQQPSPGQQPPQYPQQ
jgi:hypothetical protein